jgi:hypothetical protein
MSLTLIAGLSMTVSCAQETATVTPGSSLSSVEETSNNSSDAVAENPTSSNREEYSRSPSRSSLPSSSNGGSQAAINYEFGAAVGSTAKRRAVDECNRSGYFYDRVAGACSDTQQITNFTCDKATIDAMFDEDQLAQIEQYRADQLGGHTEDQCLDFDETKFRAYYAMQKSSGGISWKWVDIPK